MQAFNLIEELRAAEARGGGQQARLALLRARATVTAEEREKFDARLSELTSRMEAYEVADAPAIAIAIAIAVAIAVAVTFAVNPQ